MKILHFMLRLGLIRVLPASDEQLLVSIHWNQGHFWAPRVGGPAGVPPNLRERRDWGKELEGVLGPSQLLMLKGAE